MKSVARFLVALAILMTACGQGQDEEARRARLLVETFLIDASSRSGDRGWQHLSPTTQSQLFSDDLEAYRREADAAGWEGFEWEVTKVEREVLPAFVSGLTSYEDGRLTGGPTFMVRFHGLSGPPGIYQFSRETSSVIGPRKASSQLVARHARLAEPHA